MTARGEVSQRVIQREGRWKSSESSKVYTRNNPEGAGIASRRLAETGKINKDSQGKALYGVEARSIDATSEMGLSKVCYHWGSRLTETTHGRTPASRLGGGTLGFWQCDRRRQAAAGAVALVPRQWSPLQRRRE